MVKPRPSAPSLIGHSGSGIPPVLETGERWFDSNMADHFFLRIYSLIEQSIRLLNGFM